MTHKWVKRGDEWPQITYSTYDDPYSLLYGPTEDKIVVAVTHGYDGVELGISARIKKSWAETMTPDDLLMVCDRLAYAVITAREERYARSEGR